MPTWFYGEDIMIMDAPDSDLSDKGSVLVKW
jgi:hypothetical protein